MAWPKGRPRKAAPVVEAPQQQPEPEPEAVEHEGPLVPRGWIKGQLLNVRNGGEAYIITLFPDEYDPRYPEKSMRFTNPGEAQNFISKWYTQEHHDPRAR